MDPAAILELIPETQGRRCRIAPLQGGLTNRNYRVDPIEGDGGSYVLRVAGDETSCLGIDRHAEAKCSEAAAAAGLGPHTIAFLPEHGVLLRQFIDGSVLQPEDVRRPAILAELVAALRRYHDGPPGAGRFCAFTTIRSYHGQARARGVVFPERMDAALEVLARIESSIPRDELLCPCHNDLLAANFIASSAGLRIIDWEYAGMGDRFFDLGNLSVNNEFSSDDDRRLLELYFGREDARDVRRLEQMRLVSDLRESLWGFLQAGVSRLEVDYHAYGAKHLQRFLEGV